MKRSLPNSVKITVFNHADINTKQNKYGLYLSSALLLLWLMAGMALSSHAQAPVIRYNTPPVFVTGQAITPQVPVGSGVAALGYSAPATYGSGFDEPSGLATDAAGNVYVADNAHNSIKRINPDGSTVEIKSSVAITSIAVDAQGNIYKTGYTGNSSVYKFIPGTNTFVNLSTYYNFHYPLGIALDANGNVYVVDHTNLLARIPADAPNKAAYILDQWSNGIAIDGAGNTYLTDYKTNTVKMLPAGAGSDLTANKKSVITLASGFNNPWGIALDGMGSVYVADFGSGTVKKFPSGGGSVINIASGLKFPEGIALDPSGNIFVTTREIGPAVKKIKPTGGYFISPMLPAGMVFNNSTGVISGTPTVSVPAANYTVTAYNASGGGKTVINIRTAKNNADLSNLAIDQGTISPAFSAGTTTYIASAGYGVSSVNITPTAADKTATIKVNGTTVTSGAALTVPLSFGNNVINTVLTAENGTTVKTYTLTITRSAVPSISYGSGTNTIFAGLSITPLTPSGSGVAGPGYNARATIGPSFQGPAGEAIDAAGNVYVTESRAKTVIMVTPAGAASVYASGFNSPSGITIDAAGNLYVTDAGDNVVKKIPKGGGTPVVIASGFNGPLGITVDAAGNLYVCDPGNKEVKKITPAGLVTTIASGFLFPGGIAVDAAGNVFITDFIANQVKKIPVDGSPLVTIASGFHAPLGLALDPEGNIYVADYGNKALKKILPNGTITTISTGYTYINSVAVDGVGNIYAGDLSFSTVYRLKPTGGYYLNALLPAGLSFNPATGVISGTALQSAPYKEYIVAAYNSSGYGTAKVNIKVNSSNASLLNLAFAPGTLSPTFASGTTSYTSTVTATTATITPTAADVGAVISVNGAAVKSGASVNVNLAAGLSSITATVTSEDKTVTKTYTISVNNSLPVVTYSSPKIYVADKAIPPLDPTASYIAPFGYSSTPVSLGSGFSYPTSVGVDAAGNVYVCDHNNNVVKKIPAGGGTPVVIGSGLSFPFGIAVDASGIVYVTDFGNNVVKKLVPGNAPLVIGSGFKNPTGIAVDPSGNVYVADNGNDAIKKIPAGGGTPVIIASGGYSNVQGMTADAAGNLYLTDASAHTVRKIPAGGGSPVTLSADFTKPYEIAVDPAGNLYVADFGAAAVKMLPAAGGAPTTVASGFGYLYGVAVDAAGNLYTADIKTNLVKQIKPVGGFYLGNPLPAGLIFNSNTGAITGTPVADALATDYTVRAYNIVGVSTTKVNITVATTNANLSNLVLSSGTLSPAFLPGTTDYTASVSNAVTSITVKPTTSIASATIKVNGAVVASGSVSSSIPLSVGNNVITTTVTASDQTTTRTYTLTVNRRALPTISYTGPQSYPFGESITPLVPVSSNVAAAGAYSGAVSIAALASPAGIAADAAGNVYVAYPGVNAIRKIPANGSAPVNLTGINAASAVAVDASGNIYAAETSTNTIKEMLAASGVVTVGSGFTQPFGVAVDGIGNVYVADYGAGAVKMIPVGGGTIVSIGSGFSQPIGVAVDAAGNVYVADAGNNTVKMIPAPVTGGSATITLASGFNQLRRIALDAAGNIYAADYGNSVITRIPAGGGARVTIGSGYGKPYDVALDGAGNVYSVDPGSSSVAKITPLGGYYLSGLLPAGLLFNGNTGVISGTPKALSPATNYTVTAYNVDFSSQAVVNIKTIADFDLTSLGISSGMLTPAFGKDVIAYTASVTGGVASITVTPVTSDANAGVSVNGTVVQPGAGSANVPLVIGSNNISVVVIAKDGVNTKTYTLTVNRSALPDISYNGTYAYPVGKPITPLMPTGANSAAYGYKSPVTIASGYEPAGVAVDASGNVYVSDKTSIKMIPANGSAVVTIASGLSNPEGLALDGKGNIYVAEDAKSVIKMFPLAGGAPVVYTGVLYPRGVAVDQAGNIYVSDYSNRVLKIAAGTTTPVPYAGGFRQPNQLAVDAAGNVYVADYLNSCIKKVTPNGSVWLVLAGIPGGAEGLALDAAGNIYYTATGSQTVNMLPVGTTSPIIIASGFNYPFNVALGATGNVYITAKYGKTVQQINTAGGYFLSTPLPAGLKFDVNTGTISGTPAVAMPAANYGIVANNALGSSTTTINIATVAPKYVTYGDADFAPGYTLPGLTYTSSNPAAAVVINGNIHIIGAGNTIITAVKAGYNLMQEVAVRKAPLTITANSTIKAFGELNPPLTVSYSGFVYGETAANLITQPTVSTQATSESLLPSYPITVQGAVSNNYEFTYVPGTLRIVASSLVTTPLAPKTYGDPDFLEFGLTEPGVVYTSSNPAVATIVSGKIHLTGAGTATITATNGTNSINKTLTVGKAQLTVTANDETRFVDEYNPPLTLSYTGLVNGDTPEGFTVQPVAHTKAIKADNAGDYPITIKEGESNNYILTYVPGTLHVLPIDIRTEPLEKTYGDPDFYEFGAFEPGLTYRSGDPHVAVIINGEIHITGGGVAELTAFNGKTNIIKVLHVKKALLTITCDDKTKYAGYDNPQLTVTYNGFVNGDTPDSLISTPFVNTNARKASLAGTYEIYAHSASSFSYDFDYVNGTMTVLPTIDMQADIPEKTYGDPDFQEFGVNEAGISYFSTDPEVATIVNNQIHITGAGTSTIISTDGKNALEKTLTVVKAPLTITANNESKFEGDENPPLTLTYSGFVNGDTTTDLDTLPMVSTTADATSVPGDYAIDVSGAASDNYVITYVSGTLTVMPSAGGITASMAANEPKVNSAISPNGDGINDVLTIANISKYPDNKLMVMNASGTKVFERSGYDNVNNTFDGHSNINGARQQPGTYFYLLQYRDNGIMKTKTGYIVIKY